MGPDSLRQLSPSVDQEALRAQRKAGSKRADGGVRHNRRLSPVQTRFTSSTPPRFRGVFEWAVPFRLASRGELGSNCCQFTLFYTPCAFAEFFWVTHPISPEQPGRTGINLLVTLHLSQLWSRCSVREHGPHSAAAAESLWRPRGVTGSAYGRIKTSKRRRPSGHSIQWELYYWLTSGQMSLTPLPRPDACLLPPNTHGLTVEFPRGSSSSEGRARSPRTRFLEHPAHQYLVPVVHHRRSTDKHFRGWHD